MMPSRWLNNVLDMAGSRKERRWRAAQRRCAGRFFVPRLEPLEDRITPTGSITITDISVVDSNGNPLSVVNPGELVDIKADFATQGLPSNASYHISSTVNGFTWGRDLTEGAGASGKNSYPDVDGPFLVTPGTNQVSVSIVPSDPSSYSGDSMSTPFDAAPPTVGTFSYTAAQIRSAYGINNIPNFGTATADGTGQTIAIIDNYNDPTVLSDLDAFDQAMSLTTTSTQTLHQKYGPASSFLTVYNQNGDDITKNIAHSGADGVPTVDPDSKGPVEEALDVECAHAIAPGAHIDVIECNSRSFSDIFTGITKAANLTGVSAISISWGGLEGSGGFSSDEESTDDSMLTTPSGHTGITFLASTGDDGNPGSEYPAFSPHVVAVGGTDLSLNNDAYGSETAWGYTLNNGSSSYSQTGSWTAQSGGFSGAYSTATTGSNSSAYWTTYINSARQDAKGNTEVYATWTANASNATNAAYQIYDGTATTGTLLGTVTVDQTKAPSGASYGNTAFQDLGSYKITSGTLTVVLSANSANGAVAADAVAITPNPSATGGGISLYEGQPSYQNGVVSQSTTNRTTPDVAFEAGGNGGVTTYLTDYQNNGSGSFSPNQGGTSLSCPCWAGLIAIADQGRAALGRPTLDSTASSMSTLQALYSLPAGDFHDITSGYNGLRAGPGYDLLTGLGSPIADRLVPDLVNYGIPIVTTNPRDVIVTVGQQPTFTAAASGNPTPTVQWQYSSDGGTTWNIVNGATSATQTFTAAQASWNGYLFEAVFSNSFGSATTSAATLTVLSSTAAPVLTSLAPTSGPTTGGTSVTITGTGFTSDSTVSFGAVAAPSVTVNSATSITAVAPAQPASTVDVTVTNANGTSATSNADQFTYTSATVAPAITTQPTNQTVKVGDTATFTVAASGTPTPTVQWYVSGDGKTWDLLAGATSPTYTTPHVDATWDGLFFEAIFTNSAGTATTNPATLTVQYAPTVTAHPSNVTVTAGGSTQFTASASADPAATAQWQISIDGGNHWTNFSNSIPGTGTTMTVLLTVHNLTADMSGYEYRCVFTNNIGATPTNPATLTVNPLPPPPSPSASPPAPSSPPALNVPPLLALFDSLLGGVETVNAEGAATITDSIFGIPLFVASFDHSGHLVSVTVFGINVTFLFG